MEALDFTLIDEILSRYPEVKGNIIAVLHDIQTEYNYLPAAALRYSAQKLKIPVTRLYSIATFYHHFSLTPRGKMLVNICMGTACHVNGSQRIADEVSASLGIKEGETTADNEYTLGVVRCVGACSIAPVMIVNKDVYGKLNPKKALQALQKYDSKKPK